MSRNKVIVGVVLAVVVVGVIVLISLSSNSCELTDKEPVHEPAKLELIKDLAGNSLVKVGGYIKYNKDAKAKDPKNIYMPLNTTQVQLNHDTKNNLTVDSLMLDSRCAHLSLVYLESEVNTEVSKIVVALDPVNGDFKGCTIDTPKSISFTKKLHYKCGEQRSYECRADKTANSTEPGTLVATLVLNYLEFEVGGDPKKVEIGEFTTPAYTNCPK